MKPTIYLLTFLTLANASTINLLMYKAPDTSVQDFLDGFLLGFEQDPQQTTCHDELIAISPDIQKIINDLIEIAKDGINISEIVDLVELTKQFVETIKQATSCDFEKIEEAFKGVWSKSGILAALKRLFENFGLINIDLYSIVHCSENYKECGRASGEFSKIAIGVGI